MDRGHAGREEERCYHGSVSVVRDVESREELVPSWEGQEWSVRKCGRIVGRRVRVTDGEMREEEDVDQVDGADAFHETPRITAREVEDAR